MKINRSNYEEYFIDYFDGYLNREIKEELFAFLSSNPDLEKEFIEFEQLQDKQQEVVYKHKDQLKKRLVDLGPVNNETIDEYSIAYLEGELNESEKHTLQEAIKDNPLWLKTFKLYQLTKVEPDVRLRFLFKRKVKHFVLDRKIVLKTFGYTAAAAMLILAVFLFNPDDENIPDSIQISEVVEEKVRVEERSDEEISLSKEVIIEPRVEISEEKSRAIADQGNNQARDIEDKKERILIKKVEMRSVQSISNTWTSGLLLADHTGMSNNYSDFDQAVIVKNEEDKKFVPLNNLRLSLWTLAKLGVEGFNLLNETSYDVEPSFTASGELQSVTLITEKRRITTPAI